MPERVTPADPGLLASVADELALPGYGVRNLLKGNVAGAGRNLADLALNVIDAPLPGDWIPEISGAEDRPEFEELIGPIDGAAGDVVNFLGNVATDPVTYIPGAAVAKAGGAIAKGVKAVTPEVIQKGAAKVGKTVRRTFGAEKIGKPLKDVITRAQGAKETAARASQEPIVEGLKGATARELEAAGEVLTNITKDKATQAMRAIDETETLSVQDRLAKYLTDNPDVRPDKLAQIVATSQEVGRGQWASGQAGNIFTDVGRQPSTDVVMGALPGTTAREGIQDYFPRMFNNDEVADVAERLGQPNAIKGRKLDTTKDVLEYLAAHPEVKLTTNVAEVLGKRAGAQGELAARGATGQGLFDMARAGEIALPDELLAKALNEQRMAQPAKAVVGPSETAMGSDVSNMLGGGERLGPRMADPDIADPYHSSGGILGNLLDPTNSMAKWEAKQNLDEVAMGLGGQSGKSVVGKSTAPVPTGLTDESRKQAREWLLSKQYKQADPLLRETAEAIANGLTGDERDVALHMLKGMESPKGLTKMLGKLNVPFKKYAVFGAVIPKLGAITRNMTSALFQKYSTPEARGFISPKNAPQFMRDWVASIEDGIEHLFGKRLFTKNEFAQMDNAFKLGAGDPRKALAAIEDPIMRQAAERGVFGNNFVDTEQLITQASRSGIRDVGNRLMSYPASMFRGAEQRMRYGLFKDMVKSGKSPDDAASAVRSAFFDYGVSSPENRAARSLLPFFQYTAKAIPQQANLMAEKPWIASAIANLMAPGRDEPVSPQMQGKLNIPIGEDEQGNRQYISNLGLPFESLNFLPNLSADINQAGRQVQQNIVGSSQPLLKTALAATFGEDPYFGTPFQSYTKIGGQDLGRVGGTINTLLGTGLPGAVPVQGLIGMGGKTTDDRTSLGEKAVNLLTGARIASVDPDQALQQRLQAYLETRPDIGQSRVFYDKGGDVDAQELLRELAEARKAIKEKKKALASPL